MAENEEGSLRSQGITTHTESIPDYEPALLVSSPITNNVESSHETEATTKLVCGKVVTRPGSTGQEL